MIVIISFVRKRSFQYIIISSKMFPKYLQNFLKILLKSRKVNNFHKFYRLKIFPNVTHNFLWNTEILLKCCPNFLHTLCLIFFQEFRKMSLRCNQNYKNSNLFFLQFFLESSQISQIFKISSQLSDLFVFNF